MTKRILSLLVLVLATAPALAVGGAALDPSQTLYNARQLGMGGVAIGFSDDANGVLSNPSGLTNLEFPQLTGSSRKLVLDEVRYTLFGWAIPTEWGTFGLAYTGLNTGGSLPTMLDPASQRIIIDASQESISYDNNVLALSYARNFKLAQLPNALAVGGNLKFFNQTLSGSLYSKASTIGLDLAASYQPLTWLSVGANLQDLLEGNLAWNGGASDKLGGFYKLGCKMYILGASHEAYSTNQQKLYGGIDLDIPHSTMSGAGYHLGLEYYPLEKVAVRGGFSPTGLTLGLGLTSGGFRFDYAFSQNPNIPGESPHYFTLSYVGERVFSILKKLKRKENGAVFNSPKDRFITDQDTVLISAQAQEKRIIEQRRIWTVTAVSETHEVQEIAAYETISPAYMNGIKIEKPGTIESSSPLAMGRNVFSLVAYSSPEPAVGKITPEVFVASAEVRVLRFKPFKDTAMTHWALEPIALSVTLGLVKGYPDDTFRPEKGITRAELVTLLVRTLPVKLAESLEATGFTDVPVKHWAAKYIAYGAMKKLVTGYPDGSFKPNKVLTRAEGVTVLARYSSLVEEPNAPPAFPDIQPNFWANKYISPAKKAKMLEYLVGKNFEAATPFTRAEACEVLYRTPQVKQGVDQFWNTGIISAQQPAK